MGSLWNFSSILSPAFRAATVFVGISVLLSILTIVSMLFFCIFKDQAVFELCSVAQALQGQYITLFVYFLLAVYLHFISCFRSAICLLFVNYLFTFQLSVWLLEFSVFPPVGTTKTSVEFAVKRPKITALAFVALDGPSLWPLYAS